MSNDWFVGFRPLLKRPTNHRRYQHKVKMEIAAPISAVFSALIDRDAISRIIDDALRFDARHGGKLRFVSQGDEGYGGTYSLIKVPTRVVLITERHGEMDFLLSDQGGRTPLVLRATRLSDPSEESQWKASIDQVAHRLGSYVTGA